MKRKLIMERLEKDYKMLEESGYRVVGVFLQGSQNYGLDYEGSDIDTKAIVVPSFEDIARNRKPVATTLVLPSNEHIDVRDIRLIAEQFKKQNINFLEILFTDYKIVNKDYEKAWRYLEYYRESIARYDIYRGIGTAVGMAHEKLKALSHPYPSKIDVIREFGYDPKQLHHIYRLKEFVERFYMNDELFEDALISKQKDFLIMLKDLNAPLRPGEAMAKDTAEGAILILDDMKKEYRARHKHVVDDKALELVEKVVLDILKVSVEKEFRNEN